MFDQCLSFGLHVHEGRRYEYPDVSVKFTGFMSVIISKPRHEKDLPDFFTEKRTSVVIDNRNRALVCDHQNFLLNFEALPLRKEIDVLNESQVEKLS